MDLANEAWNVVSAAPWFHLIDSLKFIEERLKNPEDEIVDQTVRYLSLMARDEPDRVAEIAQSWIGRSDKWNKRLVYLLSSVSLEKSRPLFDLYLTLINDGTLDEISIPFASHDTSISLHELPKKKPDWACELFANYLDRHFKLCEAQKRSILFDDNDTRLLYQSTNGALWDSATGSPRIFVTRILPLVLQIIELTAFREGEPPWQDRAWPYHIYGERHGLKGELLNAMEAALRAFAQQAPEEFAPYAKQLSAANYLTAQFLLIRAYEANGISFANQAVDYLCEQPARLHTGYMDNGYWATRQLLDAVTPYCSEERLVALEDVILNYYSEYERSHRSYHKGYGTQFGRAQLTLLNGIDEARRSVTVTRRLEEWRRKFRIQDNSPARGMIGGFVGSPLPESATSKMTDEQWLTAIAQYSSETGEGHNETGFIGGAHQLSDDLERKVKEEPKRFAELVLRFPDNSHPYYFDAVLRGLGAVNDEVDVALKVCRRCHLIPGSPSARWICDPIKKVTDKPLPEELLQLVCWYATESSDPINDSNFGGDIEMAGLNSARGSAALTIAELIFDDKNRAAFFLPCLERLVHDPSLAVRSCAAEALTATLNYDRDLAVNLFLDLCETEDVLLGSYHVERFLYYASYTHYKQLFPIFERELASQNTKALGSGARLVCMKALLSEEAVPLAQHCLNGNEEQRKSAAQVFAAKLTTASKRILCEEGLINLFNDKSLSVREEAAKCFWHFKADQLGSFTNIVDAFVGSYAFSDKPFFLLQALKETTAKLPDVTCSACERFLDNVGDKAGDIRNHGAADAGSVGDLVIRTYAQSKDIKIQKRCLDIIDRLSQVSAYSIQQELSRLDR